MVLLILLFAGVAMLAVGSRLGFRRASGSLTQEIVQESLAGRA
jgi:hypothetical protein